TSGIVAQQFNPDFFQQFQQVSVENLQVIAETPDSIEFLGLNTYLYPDGTIQQEERTFTVEIVDAQPRLVDSAFVRITKPR
ncbi:MAG: serine/threonine protein kinase, partial [Cyanobacteria bacterium P01_D01_bin.56]